jgi:acyl-homoserine-lactone acylase
MPRWLKWSLGTVVVVAVALAVWEPFAATTVKAPQPRTYDVQIVRDKFGVPHIYGKTDADAAYGLAYAHAEDDFETIQQVIAMTRGRTGALIGADGAKVDYVQHLLGARETADASYASIPADVRAVVDGYAVGLNRYAEKHPDEVALRNLFPVNGQDIVTGFVLRAPFFYGLDNVIGRLVEGKPLKPDAKTPWTQPPETEPPEALTPAGKAPDQNGSNGWALAPSRMADGKTWLLSNSHQPYEGQVAWYEAVTHSDEGLDMAGALFPGSPFVLLGHNRNLGWTNTVNSPDLVDVYKLVLNDAGDQYRFDGKWKPLEARRVWLPVKYGPFTLPIPRTVYRSIHGPVIKNDTGAYAVRYAGIGSVKSVEQYYRNTKARDWDEWTKSMSIGGIPATNFIYADKTGRIAYLYYALFPDRKGGYDYGNILPGDVSGPLWSRSLGFDRVPKIVNPASGFVANANNTPFRAAGAGSELNPADFSPLMGIETRMTNRGLRATELVAADPSITPEELITIKMDTVYSKQSYVKPWMDKIAALNLKDDPQLAKAQALLDTWDWSSDGKGGADTLAELMVRAANTANYKGEALPDPRMELKKWVDHLIKTTGQIDPPLASFQRLRRGTVDIAMPTGGTDVLRATSVWDKTEKDGRGRVKHGDSFIMLVRWDKAGKVISESIQPYGASTTRPKSPHYTDQMQLFADGKYKPVHFEWADALAQSGKVYRP